MGETSGGVSSGHVGEKFHRNLELEHLDDGVKSEIGKMIVFSSEFLIFEEIKLLWC